MANNPRRKESLVRAIRPGLEFRDADGDTAPKLVGHFSVFNTWTRIRSSWEGDFYEMVKPGAFRKTMSENRNRMRVMLNHGNDPQVGDKPIASIDELREDETGAWYETTLFGGLPQLVLDGLRAGAYDASFRFSILQENWDDKPTRSEFNPTGLPQREIKECSVAEFGPCTFGAYPDASAGIRSLTDRFLLDALAEDPENLRELIADRRSRTFTATAPNVRVTYGPKEPVQVNAAPVEARADVAALSPLVCAYEALEQFIAMEDQPDDAADVANARQAMDIITGLIEVEAQEPDDDPVTPGDPADMPMSMNNAEPEGQVSEPVPPPEATTPPPSTEPELPVATTRALMTATTTVDGLYIPKKGLSRWTL